MEVSEVLVREFKEEIGKPSKKKQWASLLRMSDSCEFRIEDPKDDNIVYFYRGVASDRGQWRGHTQFSACNAMKKGDVLTVRSYEKRVRTTSFFTGKVEEKVTEQYDTWTFGNTVGRFN